MRDCLECARHVPGTVASVVVWCSPKGGTHTPLRTDRSSHTNRPGTVGGGRGVGRKGARS